MGRRTALLVVAALVAALGTSLVFLYVRGVDARANERFEAVEVLTAVQAIEPGESLEAAQAAGKIEMGAVSQGQVLEGVLTSVGENGDKRALTRVYPGEQIVASKFGEPGQQSSLPIEDGKMAMSVELTNPARVAGFVTPGSEVAIFVSAAPEEANGGPTADLGNFTRLLLPRVQVVGVGATTVISTTTTDQTGAQTTEEIPRTLLTVSVSQEEAEKLLFAAHSGEVSFALLTDKSKVAPAGPVTASNVFG
jgi:pilus assembly protein CpaB